MAKKGRPKKPTALITTAKTDIALVEEPNVPSVVDAQSLIARAIDKNLPIESMERLLAMRRELRSEWARDRFFTALAGFQRECPIVEKKRKVMDRDKQTKSIRGERYRYAAIEDLVEQAGPVLDRWGFSWTCKPIQANGNVKAIVHAHHRDGHEEVTEFEVPLDPDAYMSNPQKAAAALTFATRYAFKSAFGIQTHGEDVEKSPDGPAHPIREPKAVDAEVRPAPAQKPVTEVAREALSTLYRAMSASGRFASEELSVCKDQAVKSREDLNSLTDLHAAWTNEMKERGRK